MTVYFLTASTVIFAIVSVFLLVQRTRLRAELDSLSISYDEVAAECTPLKQEKLSYIKEIEQLKTKAEYLEKLIEESKALKEKSHEATKAALFELGNKLSNQLLDMHRKENSENRKQSEQNIEKTVGKFNAEFERISKMVSSLDREISQSRDTVDIIKNSLLSPSGAGALAEITLENILKSSGLRAETDFHLQYSVSGDELKNSLRPDAVVFLPGNRLMVIDSKASKFLVDNAGESKNLSKTMNYHLKSLASKNYSEMVKKSVKDKKQEVASVITLMFLPSEHAVEKILEADSNFLQKSWDLNIFPVGPSGLMNMLSFARFQISEYQMNQHNLHIIEEVKRLISAVGYMTDHSLKLGNSISSVVNHYDKFAASFNRSFLARAKKLSSLGVGGQSKHETLKRLQLFISKSELIDIEKEEIKKIENEEA